MDRSRIATSEQAHAWELRTAWALGREVLLILEEPAEPPRVRGYVSWVATTGACVLVDDGLGEDLHVPVIHVLTVGRPEGSSPRRGRPLPAVVPSFQLAFELGS
jgi:hypothetical protein